jgi:hypothetical protein
VKFYKAVNFCFLLLQDTATIVCCKRHVSQWATVAAELELVIVDSQQLFPAASLAHAAQSAATKSATEACPRMRRSAKAYTKTPRPSLWWCASLLLHLRPPSCTALNHLTLLLLSRVRRLHAQHVELPAQRGPLNVVMPSACCCAVLSCPAGFKHDSTASCRVPQMGSSFGHLSGERAQVTVQARQPSTAHTPHARYFCPCPLH